MDNEYFIVNCSDFGFIPNELGQNEHKKLSEAFDTLFDFLNGDNGLEWMKVKKVYFEISKNYIDSNGRDKFKQVYKISGREALDLYNRRMLKYGGDTMKLNDIVIYYEKEGNFMVAKGTFYAWLYDVEGAGAKMSSGEYDFILFPMGGGFSLAMQRGYVPPLLKIWKKDFQKNKKGIEHLLGIVQGYYDEKENKLYIEMMTTNPKFRRMGINGHIIKQIREEFEVSQDNVIFNKPTDMGKKFMASKKFDDGGTINKQINNNNMDNYNFNQLPHIDTLNSGDSVLIEEGVFSGNIDNPKHVGDRYIHCQVMGKGGTLNTLDLKVVQSVGANALAMGSVITRPIRNVLQNGRKLIVEPIGNVVTNFKDGGVDDLYVGDEISYKGNKYEVGGMTTCHNFVKVKNNSSGVMEEIDVDDLMDKSTLIKRNK